MTTEHQIQKKYRDTYRSRRRNIYFKDGAIWDEVEKVCELEGVTCNRLVEQAVRNWLNVRRMLIK